ncbi:phage tail spike protein [Carnobacterium maltaromaticum]|uniref:phage tail spike protein n=1 Tax=Carnobacterium maltaromaticum TaxID=2751 RepID=UPI0039BE0CD7
MYQVLIKNGPKGDELEIHSPFSNDLKLIEGVIKKGINTFDSFNLSFIPNNPAFGKMKPLTTLIRVFDNQLNKNIFKGRVLIPTDQMESTGEFNCSYTCASDLSYLQDTIQKYAKIQNTTPEQFFRYLIELHNSQAEEHKRFIVGIVTVTNSTDNVYRYVDDMATTWETIQDKLISKIGGEIRVREVNGVNYIDYVTEIGEHVETSIELAKNLVSVSKSVDSTEICTRLFPRGERQEGTEETNSDASQPRLTIASINNGKEYIDAPKALIDEFGIVEKTREWSDVTQAQVLLSKAQEFINSQKSALTQYSVSALDLSLIELDLRRFEIGNYHFLKNAVMGIDEELRIVGIGIDIINVSSSTLTIGDRFVTLSQYQSEMNKSRTLVTQMQQSQIKQNRNISILKQDVTNQTTKLNEIQNQVTLIEGVVPTIDGLTSAVLTIDERLSVIDSKITVSELRKITLKNGVISDTIVPLSYTKTDKFIKMSGRAKLVITSTPILIAVVEKPLQELFFPLRVVGAQTDLVANINIKLDGSMYLYNSNNSTQLFSFDSISYISN